MQRYPYALPTRSEDQLHAEIAALLPPLAGFSGLCGSGPQVEALFGAALSAADKLRLDAAVAAHVPSAAWLVARLRETAKALSADEAAPWKLVRAVLLTLLDEVNVLRQRDRDRSADMAAATSFADLKTRWAARASLADRTAAQAKSSVSAKLDSGQAD